jgi:hypothetical protein
MLASHAGGLIEGGAAAFIHFDFAAPLATLEHPGVHAGIGHDGMERTPAFKALQIAQFGGDQRPDNRADARHSFDRVFHAREEPLNVEVEFGELFFEELELCDHRANEQIKGGVLSIGTQTLLGRLSERFGLSRRRVHRGWRPSARPRASAAKAGR